MEVLLYMNKRIFKVKIRLVFILLLILLGIPVQGIKAQDDFVIKVGYPSVRGFTEINNGSYSGYAYDYLVEISKYTGWKYEFIEMDLNELIYSLRDGTIDLAAGMIRNEQTEAMYDFPELNAGYSYSTLSVLKENNSISASNYETFNGMKVGYFETSSIRLNQFIQFCENYGIEGVELISYPLTSGDALLEALKAKEVDAIIEGDLLVQSEEKVVARVGTNPYYFATTKGNNAVLEKLNEALVKIKTKDTNFNRTLYEKYFQSTVDNQLLLTDEEKNYINQLEPLKVVYIDNFEPMQDYDEEIKEANGIDIDILELIAKKSGLQFELVVASNYDEAIQMIKNKEVDLLLCAPNDYLLALENDYALTQTYLTLDTVNVFDPSSVNTNETEIAAMPRGYFFLDIVNQYEIQYYDTVQECIEAVKDGKATVTYGNIYTMSQYLSASLYPNLILDFDNEPIKLTMGISRPFNFLLLNILNKSIDAISDSERQDIIYSNTLNEKNHVTIQQFFYENFELGIIVIGIGVFLVGTIITLQFKRVYKAKNNLLYKSQKDGLTKLNNRETGIDLVNKYMKQKEPLLSCALLIIDIDYFKHVNDCLGHQTGDRLLIEFSQLLKQLFAYQDIIFRLGGDEFIVLMTDLI